MLRSLNKFFLMLGEGVAFDVVGMENRSTLTRLSVRH